MNITIHPSKVSGAIAAPSSKSMSQRAILAAMLKPGTHIIKGIGNSNDEQELIKIAAKLGAVVAQDEFQISITRPDIQGELNISLGESGLSTRLLLPFLSLFSDDVTIHGNGSLNKRSMAEWEPIALQIGLNTTLNEGKLPIQNTGLLQPRHITIDGSASSQYISGILLAYAGATLTESVTVTITDPVSIPYIKMTLEIIEIFGLNIPSEKDWSFTFSPKTITERKVNYTVEGDWSNAAMLMVAGALGNGIVVENVDAFTKQADKAILTGLIDAGVHMSIEATQVNVRPAKINAFQFDAVHCPDLFPPLVALAAKANGTSVISGVHRLVNKESNRAEALINLFGEIGIAINLQDDLMVIKGEPNLQWDEPKSIIMVNDHRIVMAAAIFALSMNQPLTIIGADAVNKSYPSFFRDLEKMGAQIN